MRSLTTNSFYCEVVAFEDIKDKNNLKRMGLALYSHFFLEVNLPCTPRVVEKISKAVHFGNFDNQLFASAKIEARELLDTYAIAFNEKERNVKVRKDKRPKKTKETEVEDLRDMLSQLKTIMYLSFDHVQHEVKAMSQRLSLIESRVEQVLDRMDDLEEKHTSSQAPTDTIMMSLLDDE